MSDIQFYNSIVAGTTSALSTGELAVNIADRSLMIGNSAGTAVRLNAFKWISSTRYDTTTSNISVPAGALFLEIIGCGGGGGGGGGASVRSTNVATQPNSQGGAGGGGGQGGRFLFSIKELGITSGVSTVQVNIGAGGAGGSSSGSGSNVGGSGVDGNQTWVQRTGEGITQAFVIFPGGKAGAGGGRGTAGLYNVPVETTADILDGILGEYNPSFPDDPIEYWGGEGRGGQAIGGNTGVSYLYGPDAFSGLYGGGGGGGGGGGYVFVTGGITYGVATSGGRAGTGGAFINTARTGTGGVPTGTSSSAASEGVQGTYGGAGGGGGAGGWTYSQSGRGGTGGPGGGGGGGGGGQRHYDAGSATSSGPGGRGGSGYVILRWW